MNPQSNNHLDEIYRMCTASRKMHEEKAWKDEAHRLKAIEDLEKVKKGCGFKRMLTDQLCEEHQKKEIKGEPISEEEFHLSCIYTHTLSLVIIHIDDTLNFINKQV